MIGKRDRGVCVLLKHDFLPSHLHSPPPPPSQLPSRKTCLFCACMSIHLRMASFHVLACPALSPHHLHDCHCTQPHPWPACLHSLRLSHTTYTKQVRPGSRVSSPRRLHATLAGCAPSPRLELLAPRPKGLADLSDAAAATQHRRRHHSTLTAP